MSKSNMLKEGMKGGLNGLLSSTKKPSKEQIATETTQAPPVPVSETTEVPVHCNFLINKSIHTRMKYLAIKKVPRGIIAGQTMIPLSLLYTLLTVVW